nr:diaminopimelate epimerase [Acidimicrobiia bacterium]
GNGIRCLGQAVALDRRVDGLDLLVGTAAGPRRVRVAPGPDGRTVLAEVDMGVVKVDPGPPPWLPSGTARRAALVDAGNPHLVLEVEDPSAVLVATEGPRLEANVPGGINVEWFTRRGAEAVELVVWERGAGVTEACGTGAVAVAAAVAAFAGGEGDDSSPGPFRVDMPGGSVEVTLAETASLTGPSVHVADVEVPWP